MKSTSILHEDRLKCALGMYPNEQFKLLNEALIFFQTVRFSGAEKRFIVGGSQGVTSPK